MFCAPMRLTSVSATGHGMHWALLTQEGARMLLGNPWVRHRDTTSLEDTRYVATQKGKRRSRLLDESRYAPQQVACKYTRVRTKVPL